MRVFVEQLPLTLKRVMRGRWKKSRKVASRTEYQKRLLALV